MKYEVVRLSANWDTTRREAVARFAKKVDAQFYMKAEEARWDASFSALRLVDVTTGDEWRYDTKSDNLREV